MALARALARDPTITRYLMGFTSWRLSPSALQQRFKSYTKGSQNVISTANLPFETDTRVLKTEVCGSNLFVNEGENVKIKPDSDYPDWLWELHLGKPLEPHEMDPNTKEYWCCVYKLGKEREKEMNKHIPSKRTRK